MTEKQIQANGSVGTNDAFEQLPPDDKCLVATVSNIQLTQASRSIGINLDPLTDVAKDFLAMRLHDVPMDQAYKTMLEGDAFKALPVDIQAELRREQARFVESLARESNANSEVLNRDHMIRIIQESASQEESGPGPNLPRKPDNGMCLSS